MATMSQLQQVDPAVHSLIESEKARQTHCLELIASENFASAAVMQALGSCLINKYSEGYPGARYYGGNEHIDSLERLCQKRALKAFHLDPAVWGVNVQPLSGSPANFAAYNALLQPGDRLMGLAITDGGHLTHGSYRMTKEDTRKSLSVTSKYFESLNYHVDPVTGYIDYDQLAADAAVFKPRLVICGGSAYPREWDYARFRAIADSCGAYLLMDMSHTSGLVATGFADSPFAHCDLVTTTTHKSLRGPRAAMIFYKLQHKAAVDFSVFPGVFGGPHNNQIAALAVQLKEVRSSAFRDYVAQMVRNAGALATKLRDHGYKLVTGGTDNHLVLWDLRPLGLTGSKMEKVCDAVCITLNKNTVHGDKSAFSPGGVRLGTPALTSRGFKEADFERVAELLHRAVQLCLRMQEKSGKMLRNFEKELYSGLFADELAGLKDDVTTYAAGWPMPGV